MPQAEEAVGDAITAFAAGAGGEAIASSTDPGNEWVDDVDNPYGTYFINRHNCQFNEITQE